MSRLIVAIVAFTALAWTNSSRAEEVYLVGVTAALTGPIASVSGPVVDGMRIYLDRINAAGGINGKQIRLLIRDDQSEATKAAANVKRLLEEDNVLLLINESASSTYQPTMAESKRVERPLLFLGVCPTEVYPPAQPLFFCTTSYAAHYDSRAGLDYIKEAHGSTDLKIGLMSQSIPIARAEIDYAEVRSKEMNMHPVDKEFERVEREFIAGEERVLLQAFVARRRIRDALQYLVETLKPLAWRLFAELRPNRLFETSLAVTAATRHGDGVEPE